MSDQRYLDLPKHKNPEPGTDRVSSAPYNFIPLPEVFVTAVADPSELPDHDTYADPRYPHTGYFDVTLTTKSPLYVRGGLSTIPGDDGTSEFEKAEAEKSGGGSVDFRALLKNKPDFFSIDDPTCPVIPGSSLRGMLRGLVEIASCGKVLPVSDRRLFFRALDGSSLGDHYNQQMIERSPTPVQVSPNPRAPRFRSLARGGFLRQAGGGYVIEECVVGRVDMKSEVVAAFRLSAVSELYELRGESVTPETSGKPNWTPKWAYQQRDVWVELSKEVDHFSDAKWTRNGRLRHPNLYLQYRDATGLSTTPEKGKVQGKLVLTGWADDKHLAFVFVPLCNLSANDSPRTFEVPNDTDEPDPNKRLVERFNDPDQTTQWQTQAFPTGQPAGSTRERNGYVCDGDPIFFLTESDESGGHVRFFGRAQMFRLPYDTRPIDLVPRELRRPEHVDYAEALFGFVRTSKDLEDLRERNLPVPEQGSKGRAYAGRVAVTDARLAQKQDHEPLAPSPIDPRILATPKPTAFQHYLVQTAEDRRRLFHYDSRTHPDGVNRTTIRGHKLYWHQGTVELDDLRENDVAWLDKDTGKVRANSSQHTQLQPVRAQVRFTFRIYFENLSDRELGALCWALHPRGDPQKEYCHKLGMGKPLGMGSVKLDANLLLSNRQARYQSLFKDDAWQTGLPSVGIRMADAQNLEQYTKPFEEHVLGEVGTVSGAAPPSRLADIQRIRMLLEMLAWKGAWSPQMFRARGPDSFRGRPVLPDPIDVAARIQSLVGTTGPVPQTPAPLVTPATSTAPQQRTGAGPLPHAVRPVVEPASLQPPAPRAEPPTRPVRSMVPGRIEPRLVSPPDPPTGAGPPPASSGRRGRGMQKEVVTVVRDIRDGKVRVRTKDGIEVDCQSVLPYVERAPGTQYRAKVSWENGRVNRAVFDSVFFG